MCIRDRNHPRVQVPRAAGQLLWYATQKNTPLQGSYACPWIDKWFQLFQRLTSDEVESKLTDVLLVLKYVQNKDVFMRYHKAHLTRFVFPTNSVFFTHINCPCSGVWYLILARIVKKKRIWWNGWERYYLFNWRLDFHRLLFLEKILHSPVSYTHLTLPTILLV